MDIKSKLKNIIPHENTIKGKLKTLIFYIMLPIMFILIVLLIFLFNKMRYNISRDTSLHSRNIIANYKSKIKTSYTIAKLVSETPEIVDNAELRQVNNIIQTLMVYKKELGVQYTSVHDTKGYSLGKGHKPGVLIKNDISLDYVKYGINTRKKIIGLITETPEGIAVLSVLPIYSKNEKSRFIGIASAGYLFNNYFAQIIKQQNNAHVIFFYKNRITGDSIQSNKEEYLNIQTELIVAIKHDRTPVIRINGISHETRVFKAGSGKNALRIIIAVNTIKERVYFWITVFLIIVGVALGIIISLKLSTRFSSRITGPINNLVEVSGLVSKGNLSVRASVHSNDELELLGDTFNYMIKKIEDKQKVIIGNFNNAIQIINAMIANSSTRLYEFTRQVTNLSVLLAGELGLSYKDIWNIEIASLVHDLGMLGYGESLHYSKRVLTDDEENYLQAHIHRSIDIIKNLPDTEDIIDIISQHHERFNGKGYPHSIKGDDIVIGAKIIGICDDFVHLTKKREFQVIEKKQKIIKEFESRSGVYYDPEIAKALINLINKKDIIYIVNEDDIKTHENSNEYCWEIPSNINLEQVIVARVINYLEQYDIDFDELFKIEFSVSEVIRNAIVHGNKYDEQKKIKITASLKVLDSKEKFLKLVILDQGHGMDVREHTKFTDGRKHISKVLGMLEEYKIKNKLDEDNSYKEIITGLKTLKSDYYSDFNTFQQFDDGDLSGGLGLVQVKNSFDNVVFENIMENNKICGLKVTLEKNIS